MKKVVYRSATFDKNKIAKRYAAWSPYHKSYKVFDVDSRGWTIREYLVARSQLPERIADECDRMKGQAFNQVEITK